MRVAIVGAGVIGLAVAYHVLAAGAEVILIDQDPEGDKASLGNAGGIAVTEVMPASSPAVWWRLPRWMLDPLGPLSVRPAHALQLVPWLWRFAQVANLHQTERISRALAALNSRVYEDLVPMLGATGLPAELHQSGALTLYESEAGFQRDRSEWTSKAALGIVAHDLTPTEARQLEPALGPRVRRAVLTPQWSHVSDPRRIVEGVRHWLQHSGARVVRGEVRHIGSSSTSGLELILADASRIAADRIVVAAGAWSGRLAQQLGDRVLLESERGYNLTLSNPGVQLNRMLIFAEHKFVASPLSCGLRIGGAAELGGLHAVPNFERSHALAKLARRYLPDLNTANGTSWAGHRPATPDSLPVIGPSRREPCIYYAFGHGHLGLTQSATTGRIVSDLLFGRPPPLDVRPYSIARFARD